MLSVEGYLIISSCGLYMMYLIYTQLEIILYALGQSVYAEWYLSTSRVTFITTCFINTNIDIVDMLKIVPVFNSLC